VADLEVGRPFGRFIVKHGTQNIPSDCHQWLSDSFRVHRIRFRPGLRPDPTGGAYSASDPLAGLKDPTSKGQERRGRGKERKGGEEGDGRDRAPFWKFLYMPLTDTNYL